MGREGKGKERKGWVGKGKAGKGRGKGVGKKEGLRAKGRKGGRLRVGKGLKGTGRVRIRGRGKHG